VKIPADRAKEEHLGRGGGEGGGQRSNRSRSRHKACSNSRRGWGSKDTRTAARERERRRNIKGLHKRAGCASASDVESPLASHVQLDELIADCRRRQHSQVGEKQRDVLRRYEGGTAVLVVQRCMGWRLQWQWQAVGLEAKRASRRRALDSLAQT
jgi:hypothetical protein